MKKYVFGLGALVAPSVIGMLVMTSCTKEDGTTGLPDADAICGECGEIAKGDVGITGDVRLDGFFKALVNVQKSTASIKADFDANIRALAAVYDVDLGAQINAQAVQRLSAAIRDDFDANIEGSLSVEYQPPRCQASLDVALEAEAQCEVKAGCEVQATPGEVSVSCQGQCTGSCSGECSGDFSCELQAPSVECEGRCEGSCTLEAAATCNGTCRGTCSGECSAHDANGQCAGDCAGECQGTCELAVAADCGGTCTGKCLVTPGEAGCAAEASCRGSCDGSCSGSCEGNFTPPSASAECDARADCQASARAEANASLECTPPQFKLDYSLRGGATANMGAKAEFTARINELKARGIAIVQGAAKFQALIDGRVGDRVVFNPSPVAELGTKVTALLQPNAIAKFNIPAGKLPCVVPAFEAASDTLGSIQADTSVTLAAQAEFVEAFTAGFPAPPEE